MIGASSPGPGEPGGTPDILLQIAAARAERVRREGAAQGLDIPASRQLPLVDFLSPSVRKSTPGILIAEVKRRSPSKGDIADIPEPAVLAGRYKDSGFRRISVLTEEARFGGSLSDLVAVKTAHPDLSVLRKDFLLSVEDVDVSYRSGADAILLIATLLDADVLEAMFNRAAELGLTCLVEVHAAADVDKVRSLAPPLLGINSRDLRRFKLEPLLPLETRNFVDWNCSIVYESGILGPSDAAFVRGTDFSGFLVGEAVARDPGMASSLLEAWKDAGEARRKYTAWKQLYERFVPGKPLVKICGITNRTDALAAVDAGADMLGFVMAESPRKTTADFIRSCTDLPVLKAAVVVLGAEDELPGELSELLDDGSLDFIQFHGEESPETVRSWPSYKALNLRTAADAERLDTGSVENPGSPAVLVDAFSADARGGTGKRLDPELVAAASERRRLWLAGGLNSDNVAAVVAEYSPGLVDVSSGIEAEKGRKDPDKLCRFVAAAKGVTGRATGVIKEQNNE